MAAPGAHGNRKFLYAAVCIGNLAAFTCGLTIGWSSPVNAKLLNETKLEQNPLGRIITTNESSWIGSLLALGSVFGPLLAGFSSDKLGRKKTLIICVGVPFVVSFLVLAFAEIVELYYVARFLGGCAAGSVFAVLPNFNSEIAEDSTRGAVSSSMNVFVSSGTLFAYVLGPYLSIMWFNIICAAVPVLFIILFFLLVPESPYYFLMSNDSRGAFRALKKFRSTSEKKITKELEGMRLSMEESLNNKGSFLKVFKSKGLTKALIISLSLVTFQMFSGITVILFYAQIIFDETGSSIPSEISSMIIGAVQLGASLVTPLVVDKFGRKILLLLSAVGMVISEAAIGLYFYLKDHHHNIDPISWLPILCLVVYIIVYSLGFGPLPWTVMAEIFPSEVKSSASTATTFFGYLIGFMVNYFFASVSEQIGIGGSFWLFSGCCVLAAVFVLTVVVETKGKSFQEIQKILAK